MKEKIVLAFGCFDILHPGHCYYLKSASKLGNKLIVVIARDVAMNEMKKRKPIFNEKIRKEMIQHLDFVDKAVLGSKTNKMLVLSKYKPHVIALGYDQPVDMKKLKEEIKKLGLKTRVIRLKAFKSSIFKSSKIRKYISKRK